MNAQNTLCLIVDIQSRLVPAMLENQIFVQKCQQLLTGLKALDVPFVLTEQYPRGLGSTLDEIKTIAEQSLIWEKTQFSAFLPEIEDYIAQNNIKNVILIGAETHVCVLQTAADLRENGLNVYLPLECVTSRTAQNKANGLSQIEKLGGVVSNIESLLFGLLKDAKHPEFKTISKLIV